MTDSAVRFASTVFKSCCFLNKVCINIPKELCFMHSFEVCWGKKGDILSYLPSIADILLGDWPSSLVWNSLLFWSPSWHSSAVASVTNKLFTIFYRKNEFWVEWVSNCIHLTRIYNRCADPSIEKYPDRQYESRARTVPELLWTRSIKEFHIATHRWRCRY